MCAPEAVVAKSLRRGERGLLSGAHDGDDPFAGIPSPPPVIPRPVRARRPLAGPGAASFGRAQFPCFWPPELGVLDGADPTPRQRRHQCVILDSEHVHPRTPMRWGKLRHRPYPAQLGAEQIVVRDRDISNATCRSRRYRPSGSSEQRTPAPGTATSRCSSHGDRRRQRRMVPHRHTWQRLLNGLLRRLTDPTRADQAGAVRPTGPKRAATSTGQGRGSTAATSTSSSRPASSPDVPTAAPT